MSVPRQFVGRHQQQSRSYITDSSQPRMSFYTSRSSTNSHVVDDRCAMNNSTSLQITVINNGNNDGKNKTNKTNHHYHYSQDTSGLIYAAFVIFVVYILFF